MKTRKDIFTLLIVMMLVGAVVVYNVNINDLTKTYDTQVSTVIDLCENKLVSMNASYTKAVGILTSQATNLTAQIATLNAGVVTLQNIVSNLTASKNLLITQLNNINTVTSKLGKASISLSNAQVNDTLATFWYSNATLLFSHASNTTLGNYLNAKNSSVKASQFYNTSKIQYNNTRAIYKDLSLYPMNSSYVTLTNLWISYTTIETSMMKSMVNVTTYLGRACNNYYQANGTNAILWNLGRENTTRMNSELNSYNALKTIRNTYMNQILAQLDNM
jgi:hypothetical protein